MEFFIVSALNGLIYGMLLFMVSAGLTLTFGMMGILNFSHAAFYMLGAYLAYTISSYTNFWIGILVVPPIVAMLGVVIERYILRPVHRYGHAHELLVTFGLVFIFDEFVKLFYGNYPVSYQVPAALDFPAFSMFGASYPFYKVFIGLVALLMFLGLYLVLTRTRIGMIVRGAERLPHVAQALGHNVTGLFTAVFAAGAALAALAGAVAGAFYQTNPNMAWEIGIVVFVVVVIGGLGSLGGSFIASVLIGLLNSFAVGLDWTAGDLMHVVGLGDWVEKVGGFVGIRVSSFAATIPFLLMLGILLVRPAGLMGSKN